MVVISSRPQMWVFGYGSLLWNPGFEYERQISGVVKGYARRFWQLSPDHRGTPDAPGRTVTIVPDAKDECWGIAYKVPDAKVAATRAYLDEREKAGYTLQSVRLIPDDGSDPFDVSVYVSPGECDEWHAGPGELEEIAQTILSSHGPSGSNLEYMLRLADCLHKKAPHIHDQHIFALEKRLLELAEKCPKGRLTLVRMGHIRDIE